MKKLAEALSRSPATVTILSYSAAAILGTVLFFLPFATKGDGLRFVDAFFLSTSAICVTGLSPVASLHDVLTDAGWWVLLALIQLGGVGLVLMGIFALRILGRGVLLRHAEALRETYAESGATRRIVSRVLLITFCCEAAGAFALWPTFEGVDRPFRSAIFHSVSAFCNAGFSNAENGLIPMQSHWRFNLVMMTLIVVGGLGYRVCGELLLGIRRMGNKVRFTLHTKVVLSMTAILIALGAFGFFVLEWNSDEFSSLPFSQKILASLFQSVTTRTAGFNTVDIGELNTPTLLYLCSFMVIGGSPGSTAGGFKTLTLALLIAATYAQIRGREETVVAGRRVTQEQIRKALSIASIYMLTLLMVVMGLAITVQNLGVDRPFLALLFESCSALGTVGLSVGVTPDLPQTAKLMLLFTMLVGRVGPLTMVLIVPRAKTRAKLTFPEEQVGLG